MAADTSQTNLAHTCNHVTVHLSALSATPRNISTNDSKKADTNTSEIPTEPSTEITPISCEAPSSETVAPTDAVTVPCDPIPSESDGADLSHSRALLRSWRRHQVVLSDDELAQGFVLKKPNAKYLGFIPTPWDRRPFLGALAIVEANPSSRVTSIFPVSWGQRCFLVLFYVLVGGIVAATVFFMQSLEGL